MKTLVIGAGEVGKSLYQVLKGAHEVFLMDIEPLEIEGIEVLNICFPYFEGFEKVVGEYQDMYKPELTIIHSTVPPGTSRKLNAVHSPIHGKHPDLSGGIRTFIKYVGAANQNIALEAAKFLNQAGINTEIVSSPEASELSKLLCTTQYGWNIIIMKEIYKICLRYGVNFEEVYGWNEHYNDGYIKLGMKQFVRPRLKYTDGKIGGHCVVPNTRLLDSWLTRTLKEKNDELS